MRWNLPNILTLLRIAAIPVFVVVFYLPFGWSNEAVTVIFALAAITDWLDGFLARRMGVTSAFGAFLDPVADKLMVAAALVLLVDNNPTSHHGLLMALPAVVIIGREITISALREWMAEVGERASIAVSWVGKVKTTAQMAALLLLLYQEPFMGLPAVGLGFWLLYLAAVLTLWSMIVYLRAAWPIMARREA
ncbi:MAG: CDP-diacylglycerol--glycerol-3-phosphate 3-phosphatidyltransferase [Pseudomonadota bacterium]